MMPARLAAKKQQQGMMDMTLKCGWIGGANELLMISFRADQSGRVQRVNDNKQVCKEACCCRGVIYNNERGAGGCGVESLVEMSGG